MPRGLFIVFEGIDHSGKTTQSLMLYEKLKTLDIPCVHIRFPDRETITGKIINEYLSNKSNLEDHVIHLLFSANRWEKNNLILEWINNGITVICDRYAYSGVAFTAAKGYNIDWCKGSDIGLVEPDVLFYLNIDVKDASEREGFGNERYEIVDLQEKIASCFDKLLCNATRVCGNRDKNTIHDEIINVILPRIQEYQSYTITPIPNKLWLTR